MNTCAMESVFQTYYPLDIQLFNEQIFKEELKDDFLFTKRLQQSPNTQRNFLNKYKQSVFYNPNIPPPQFSIKHIVKVIYLNIIFYY